MTKHAAIATDLSQRISFRPCEAEQVVGVHRSTVYRWIKNDGLASHKIAGTTLILVSDFLDFVRRMGG